MCVVKQEKLQREMNKTERERGRERAREKSRVWLVRSLRGNTLLGRQAGRQEGGVAVGCDVGIGGAQKSKSKIVTVISTKRSYFS